jgi:hypothetical protein
LIHSIPHRSAVGALRRSWEYVPEWRRLVVSVMLGSLNATFAVEICAAERPVFGAVPIKRTGGETWRVLPERYIRTWPGGVERLEPLSQAIASELGVGESLILTNTPLDVSAIFEVL